MVTIAAVCSMRPRTTIIANHCAHRTHAEICSVKIGKIFFSAMDQIYSGNRSLRCLALATAMRAFAVDSKRRTCNIATCTKKCRLCVCCTKTPQGDCFGVEFSSRFWNAKLERVLERDTFFSFTCGIQNFGPKTVVLYQTVKLEFGSRFLLKFWLESWHGAHRDTDTCDGGGLQHEIR